MKKTLIALVALSGLAMADVTLHGITFDGAMSSPMQSIADKTQNFLVDAFYYGNLSSATTYGGFYVTSTGGIKTNATGTHTTVTYLYIDPAIVFSTGNTGAGQIAWSSNSANNYYAISSTEGAWVDIDADYDTKVRVNEMVNGTVYLHSAGYLSGALTGGNKVVVDGLDISTVIEAPAHHTILDNGHITRTLIAGDFSSWTADDLANVTIEGGQGYAHADAQGLHVTYTPEPATATLSLLALAALANRRKRR